MPKFNRIWSFSTIAAATLLLVACGDRNKYVAPPAPAVTVELPMQGNVTMYNSIAGQTAALNKVTVIARVKGFLETVDFSPSTHVERGQLLFTIEPYEYQAALDASMGKLTSAFAKEALAETTYQRNIQLYANDAVSELDLLNTKANLDLAKGEVEQARAAVRTAELNLSYTKIIAEISGRISRELVSVGNVVGTSGNTALTTIIDLDPMYVYFNVDERTLIDYKMYQEKNKEREIDVELELADGTLYNSPGRVDYISNEVNPTTGTIELRAVFANPNRTLIPGLFANLRFASTIENALVVPDYALMKDLVGDYVMVVNKEGVVENQYVKKGALVGEGRVISEGLKPEDRVIVKGLQRAREGMKVNAKLDENV